MPFPSTGPSSGSKAVASSPGIAEATLICPKRYCAPSDTVKDRKNPLRSRESSAVEESTRKST